MFKRNLLKRTLPVMLSVAMTFQSVPITAMAAEDPPVTVSAEAAEPEAETEAEPTEDLSESGSGEEAAPAEDAAVGSGEEAAPTEDVSAGSGEETAPVENTDDGSGSDTVGNDQNTESGAGTETGTEIAVKPETDTKTETTETDQAGAEISEAEPSQDAQAEIVSTEIKVGELSLEENFERQNGADGHVYTTTYSTSDQFDGVMDSVIDGTHIEVNGEKADGLKETYLTAEWKKVAQDAEGKEVLEAMTGTPENVGSYALHLEVKEQTGLCGKDEYNVYFNITPQKLSPMLPSDPEADPDAEEESFLHENVPAGSKVADFKEKFLEGYRLWTDEEELKKDVQYSAVVKVYKDGDTTKETEDAYFSKNENYSFAVEVTLDPSLQANYELESREYQISFSGLLKTQIAVTLKEPGKEIVKSYEKGKTYTAEAIATEYVTKAEVKVDSRKKDDNEQPIFVDFDGDAKDETGKAVPKWFTKENKDGGINDFPDETEIDEETQFFSEDKKSLYTLVEEEAVGDAGDYYLVYVYAGKAGSFEKSYSDPIKVTIDPVEVILKPTKIEDLNTSMNAATIARALAKVEFELRKPDAADPTAAGAEKSDADVQDGFWGVSYDDADKTQYYTPVFELWRKTRTKLPEKNWPANATEDQKWTKWSSLASFNMDDFKPSDDETQYEYYVVFTGKKAVYSADGTIVYETVDGQSMKGRPITETTTDSAERNYRVKADEDTLKNEKNALKLEGDAFKVAEETSIDVQPIIAAFTDKKDGTGVLEAPAWRIYDEDAALFADRNSYKKAVVNAGSTKVAENVDADLTYTWEEGSISQYETFIHMNKPAETDKNYQAWETAKKNLEDSFNEETQYSAPQNAGIYRLHIEYKDNSLTPQYASSENDVYFLIRQQELIFVPDTQYAEYGDDVDEFTKRGYSIYEVPENDESQIAFDDAHALNWDAGSNVTWRAVNLKKNADGSNTTEWETSSGSFIEDQDHPYTYKAAAGLRNNAGGSIKVKDTDNEYVKNQNGDELNWRNYTTRNHSAWDAENKVYRQHSKNGEAYGEMKFGATEIEISVDPTKLSKEKVYDGKPFAAGLPEGYITLKNKTTEASIPVAELTVNGEPGTEGVVRAEWKWVDGNGKIVPIEEAVYGGTYELVVSYERNEETGTEKYKALGTNGIEWVSLLDKDGKPYQFEITPLEVVVTPKLKEEVKAGEPLRETLEDWHVDVEPADPAGKIPDGKGADGNADGSKNDTWLFERGSGIIRDEIEDLDENYEGYPILGGEFVAEYYENNQPADATEVIRSGRTYDVKFSDSNNNKLFAQYKKSYHLTFKAATLAKIVRGDADVRETDFYTTDYDADAGPENSEGQVSVHWEKDENGNYVIKPREGIPFVYAGDQNWIIRHSEEDEGWAVQPTDLVTGEKIPLDKNYIAVNIVSPREFSREYNSPIEDFAKNFVYGNSINKAGGYVIGHEWRETDYDENDENTGSEYYRYFITALFPVEYDEENKTIVDPEKEFDITWEKDYKEHFKLNLTDAKLEANLKKAVAPKSLAFNGVISKMAVGEEQQLDVKITKAQLGDVIQVRYRISEKDSAKDKVNATIDPETGRITALKLDDSNPDRPKPVTVEVEAYPVRLAENGKVYEPIEKDEKGKAVKVAKTKITVTPVDTPAIKKIVPADMTAKVQYTQVGNGYRREIYVVKLADKSEASQWKTPAQFETAIKGIKNGQWKGTFAIAPKYVYGRRDYDEKLKLCVTELTNLEAGVAKGSYVIYVRNVSAVRTLADGSKVSECTAGSVKAFETTKSAVERLDPYFEVLEEVDKNHPVRYKNGEDDGDGYIVNLTDKSAQLLVDGWFKERPLNSAADADDGKWWPLPLKAEKDKTLRGQLTNAYLEPKLSYYVTDYYDLDLDNDFDAKGKLKYPSKYATITNKGKISLKGVDLDGDVTVCLWVVADNKALGSCELTISARPTEIKVKKPKAMKVGDGIRLADYLEYKQGKVKVPNYWSSSIDITNWDEIEAAGFEIHQVGDGDLHYDSDENEYYSYESVDGTLRKGEYIITAVKPNSGKCTLKFTDWLWNEDLSDRVKSTEQTMELSTVKLDAVKSLKTVYTDDRHITLNFAHAGHPDAFDIEVTDARGSVIFKKLAYRDQAMRNMVSAEAKPWRQNEQKGIVEDWDGESGITNFKYFEKTKTYAYTIQSDKLLRLSAYTVSVKPVYRGETVDKPANTKAKTTNIPASYGNADITNPENSYHDYYGPDSDLGGAGIVINNLETYLTSGNTYTLEAECENDIARSRGTDTLTWKSSNTKVASVKANQGSFSATLKAMQQGRTTITVTSKVTKKTIARYFVAVKAVGNGSHYGGDFEDSNDRHDHFYDAFINTHDPYYEGKLEVLTVSNPVEVTQDDLLNRPSNDRTWVQFTAPAYGEYTFDINADDYGIYYYRGTEKEGYSNKTTLRLEEGQKIYFRVSGAFTLSVSSYTDFTKLTTAFTEEKPLKATKNMWVSFTAPEDNYYTFHGGSRYEQNGVNADLDENGGKGMKAGETIFIYVYRNAELYVTTRDLTKVLEVGGKLTLSFTKDNAKDTQYAKFTATATGDYTFEYPTSDKVTVQFLAVDGSDDVAYYDGDAVMAKLATFAVDGTEGTETPKTEKTTLFIEAGEAVVVEVKAADLSAITDDTKKVEAVITVTSTAVEPLVLGDEKPVTKETSKTFVYTIPNDKTATRYTVAATENAEIAYFDARHNSIDDFGNTFTVKDGKVEGFDLEAGDQIYIKVTAQDKDSKVTITGEAANKTFAVGTPPASENLSNSFKDQWYTFTVTKAGYYQFTTTVSEAPKHGLSVTLVDKAFSEEPRNNPSISLSNTDVSEIMKLDPDSYVFRIHKTSDSAADTDVTTATLSVTEITAQTLNVGETPVPVKKGEMNFYSFKASDNGTYTIKWTPDADTGAADARYTTEGMNSSYSNSLPVTVTSSSNTCFIRVEATGDKDVSGKLTVEKRVTDTLTSGEAKTFTFTEDGDKTYTFVTPEKSDLGYIITVENTSAVAEGQTVPTVSVEADGSIVTGQGKGKASGERRFWNKAFETKTITVSVSGTAAAAGEIPAITATGSITVQPIKTEVLPTAAVKIAQADSKWYIYTIPADGRYTFDKTVPEGQDAASVTVTWYRKNSSGVGSAVSSEAYLKKGQELYVNVKAGSTIAAAGVDVTVSAKPLTADPLTMTDGKAEIEIPADKQKPAYYTFSTPAYGTYTVTGGLMKAFDPEDDDWRTKDEWEESKIFEKGVDVLVKVTEAGKLTLTRESLTELTVGTASTPVTLKIGESASFSVKPYKAGYYDFSVSASTGLSAELSGGDFDLFEDGCYYVSEFTVDNVGGRYEYTVTNKGTADATFTVTVGELVPVVAELGKAASVPVKKGGVGIAKFKVPETYRYTVTCDGGSQADTYADDDVWYEDDEQKLYLTAEQDGDVTVTISKLQPTSIVDNKAAVTLGKGEAAWYSYKAAKTADCTFKAPDGVSSMSFYESLDSEKYTTDSSFIVEEGAEVYIKLSNGGETEVKGDLIVTPEVLQELEVGKDLTFKKGDHPWLVFKAPADGFYRFVNHDDTGNQLRYYGWDTKNKPVEISYVDADNQIWYFVMKDEPVYLEEYNQGASDEAKVSVESKKTITDVTPLEMKDASYISSAGTVERGAENWYAFTAKEDSTYYFGLGYSSNSTTLNLYKSGAVSNQHNVIIDEGEMYYDSTNNSSRLIDVEMEAGQTVYFKVFAKSGKADYNFSIQK